MGLENADIVANFIRDAQQFVGCVDIGGYAEIGALYRDEAEQVGGQRGRMGLFGARGEWEGEGRMPYGGHNDRDWYLNTELGQ